MSELKSSENQARVFAEVDRRLALILAGMLPLAKPIDATDNALDVIIGVWKQQPPDQRRKKA